MMAYSTGRVADMLPEPQEKIEHFLTAFMGLNHRDKWKGILKQRLKRTKLATQFSQGGSKSNNNNNNSSGNNLVAAAAASGGNNNGSSEQLVPPAGTGGTNSNNASGNNLLASSGLQRTSSRQSGISINSTT
jgi:hypothetical protein